MSNEDDHLPANRSSASTVDAFLNAAGKAPAPFQNAKGGGGRLLFAMDATASREPSWDMAARIQNNMFDATQGIGGLQVQLAFFRGFEEFRVSKWLSDASEIHRLMSSVYCLAGRTQIDKVFKHARNEAGRAGVRAVIYVGDSFEENVDAVGQVAGELGILGVPAFVFHEGHDPTAARAFKQFAKLSGGAYVQFDAASPDILKKLLSAVAVFAAGGRSALDDYAQIQGGDVLAITNQMKGGT
ncbi:VWA domain-containing protein [Magnetovibrio sp. PR-2]|uniref:VWA domain-containing protein n=1 Tax=Magnetovibrio sp. PR-2 TaxID=3120356 RepID=UPI002FCDFE9D